MWDWDEAKRQANLTKHGLDFAEVAGFDWQTAQVEPDLRRDYGEDRWVSLGRLGEVIHHLVFTRRDGRIRIISLRKANRREKRKWASRNI